MDGAVSGAVSGPTWPQMVPLKLSLQMMSHKVAKHRLCDYNCHLFFIMHCFMQ